MTDRQQPQHLRNAATICPETISLGNGTVISRCERERGHDGKHKDFCSHWGNGSKSVTAEAVAR